MQRQPWGETVPSFCELLSCSRRATYSPRKMSGETYSGYWPPLGPSKESQNTGPLAVVILRSTLRLLTFSSHLKNWQEIHASREWEFTTSLEIWSWPTHLPGTRKVNPKSWCTMAKDISRVIYILSRGLRITQSVDVLAVENCISKFQVSSKQQIISNGSNQHDNPIISTILRRSNIIKRIAERLL